MSYHPKLRKTPMPLEAQVATNSVLGDRAQDVLARVHVGIVGLGIVGSIAADRLSRTGIQRITLIYHDIIEERKLDSTLSGTLDNPG